MVVEYLEMTKWSKHGKLLNKIICWKIPAYNFKTWGVFMIRRNYLYFILTIAFSIIAVFGINYLVGSDFSNIYYGMTRDFRYFEKLRDNNITLDFLKKYDDIKVIAKTNNDSVIGVYDPSMFYYSNSSKIISNGEYRYFSTYDYKKNSNVSILSYPVVEMFNNGMTISQSEIKYFEEEYNTDIIHVFDIYSEIFQAEEDIKIAKNLFSINRGDITSIYIDSDSNRIINEATSKLISAGFNIKSKANSIYETIKISFKGRLYVKFFLISTILFYILFIVVSFIFLSKYKIYMNAIRICGASIKEIFLNKFITNLVITLLISTVSMELTILYLDSVDLLSLTRSNISQIYLLVLVTIIIVNFISFAMNTIYSLREVR